MLYTIVSFFGVLIVLILAHELGHFTVAKLAGVKVDEFGLGFPPRIFGKRVGETVYSINAVPLGGFVKMAGEEDPSIKKSLASKKPGIRLLVLGAGSLVNIALPILLFGFSFMIPRQVTLQNIFVDTVSVSSPAESAGIIPGDRVLKINGEKVNNLGNLHLFIQLGLGKEIEVTILREGIEAVKQVKPRWNPPEGEGPLGITVKIEDAGLVSMHEPFWRAIPMGAKSTWETLVLFRNQVVSNFVTRTVPEVTGPIGIAQLTGEVARAGLAPLFNFAAFLSLNLGIINLFPLPALDGGRIAFVLLEVIRRGKRISPRAEGLVHLVGFMLLISFVLVISYYDIVKIVGGEGILR